MLSRLAPVVVALGLAIGVAVPASAGGTPTTFTSISPVTGSTSGGTAFTITGSGFTSATTVTIGGAAATSVVDVSSTSLTGVTPAGVTGAQDVVVTDPTNGSVTATGAFTYSSVVLSSSSVVAGTSLDVSGFTIPGATVVASFDHVSATVSASTTTGSYLATLTPQKATSAGYLYSQVNVSANAATISTAADVATVTQALTGASQLTQGTGTCSNTSYCLDPSLAPGTQYDVITLIGSGLTNYVSINNSDFVGTVGSGNPSLSSLTGPYVTFANASGVQYVAAWVWAGQIGPKWVLYSVAGTTIGSPVTSEISGTYVATPFNDPAITGSASITFDAAGTSEGFSPMVGSNAGGTNFTISIAGSYTVTGVSIGGVPVTSFTTTVSSTSPTITSVSGVTAPATAGLDSVVITYTGGSFTLPSVFTYVGFAAISPSSGPTWAPQAIVITGGGFTGSTGATIGGNPVSSFQVVSDTEITGFTPTGGVGPANVVIASAYGNLIGVGAYTYLAVPLNSGGGTSSLQTQAPLVITSTSGTAGTPLTLTTSGGSGTGAVSFTLVSAGSATCALNGAVLSASSAGTCTVSATKAADATYAATSSPATTITFAAPPAPPVVRLHVRAIRFNGAALVGRTVVATITGVGFYAQPTITSNEPGTRVGVLHDNGRTLVVRVSVAANAATGWHTLTITLADGTFCRVNYLVK